MHIVLAWIEQDGFVLQTQFPERSDYAGQWGLPGGKVESGEIAVNAILRECQEELGIELEDIEHLYRYHSSAAIQFDVWQVFQFQGKPYAREQQGLQWVAKEALMSLSMPPANYTMIPNLLNLV